jgi:hypothetical protein
MNVVFTAYASQHDVSFSTYNEQSLQILELFRELDKEQKSNVLLHDDGLLNGFSYPPVIPVPHRITLSCNNWKLTFLNLILYSISRLVAVMFENRVLIYLYGPTRRTTEPKDFLNPMLFRGGVNQCSFYRRNTARDAGGAQAFNAILHAIKKKHSLFSVSLYV